MLTSATRQHGGHVQDIIENQDLPRHVHRSFLGFYVQNTVLRNAVSATLHNGHTSYTTRSSQTAYTYLLRGVLDLLQQIPFMQYIILHLL